MLQCQHRDYWRPTLKTLRSQHLVRSRHPHTGNRRYMWGVFTKMSRGERITQASVREHTDTDTQWCSCRLQVYSLTSIALHGSHLFKHFPIHQDLCMSVHLSTDPYISQVGQRAKDANKVKTDGESGTGVREETSAERLADFSFVCAQSCLRVKTTHNPRLLLTLVPHIRWNRTIQTTSTQVLTAQTFPELSVQSWAKNTTRRGDEISCDHYSQTNTAQHLLWNCLQLCKLFILLLFPPFCDPIPVVSYLLLLKQNSALAKSPSLLNSFHMIHEIPQEHRSFEKSQLIF